MGCSCMPSSTHTHLFLIICFLLVSTSPQVKFLVEGLKIRKLLEVTKVNEEEKLFLRARIGSRPPICAKRCPSCVHCEAVQVPVAPQDRSLKRHSTKVSAVISSYREDASNYKPMSWKCKCGDTIFNP